MLLLGDIHSRPEEAFESRTVNHRNPDPTYVTSFSIGSHNPLREVESEVVIQHLLNPLLHEFTIFRVHEIQIFLYCWRLASRIKAVNSEQFGRPVVESSSVECPATHMSEAVPFAEVGLGLQQGLLRELAIIDIGQQEIPGAYRTFRIAHWEAANLEPSIDAIGAPTTVLNRIDLARFDGLCQSLNHAGKVIRMNGIDEGPVLQILICLAEILQDLAIEELDLARCAQRSYEPRNVVDDLPPGHFPRAQAFLSPLAILDIQIDSVPFDDFPRFVSQWVRAK